MKLSALFCALLSSAEASSSTCITPSSTGYKYTDSAAKTFDNFTLDECCKKCDEDDSCMGYSFKVIGLFSKNVCEIHSSASLPKSPDSQWACAMKPAKPTPAAPTPPPPAPTPKPPPFTGGNWAVIIAGSSTFANYRHQADACHAYQIVKKNGIPESNIILMMEDDVANDKKNPYPGKLFNRPTAAGDPGVDVYDGCKVDYKGNDVTAKNFLAVLTGDVAAMKGKGVNGLGKVLQSTATDNVFINFADHGGGEIVEMPNGPYLHAKDLVSTLQTMHTSNMYKKLVFYMEACNGGSMFANLLPADINVFATTAADPKEPSWGTYCPPQDTVNGKVIGACLGDLYSVNWMEDSDAQGEGSSLEQQYEKVVKLTNKSHPTMYGTETWKSSAYVEDFQGHVGGNSTTAQKKGSAGVSANANPNSAAASQIEKHAVDQRDIELLQVFYNYLRADEHADGTKMTPAELAASNTDRSDVATQLVQLVQARENDDALFTSMLKSLSASSNGNSNSGSVVGSDAHSDCVKSVTSTVVDECGKFSSYSLKYHHLLVEYCSKMPQDQIIKVVANTCVAQVADS